MKTPFRKLIIALILPLSSIRAAADNPASLERGYRLMYGLDFRSAEREFLTWHRDQPGDPLAPVSEAANLLFSEFERLGILEAQFYVDGSWVNARAKLSPDPDVQNRFNAALNQAETLARQQLAKDSSNRDALFALTLAYGLRADYAALIQKRNITSLGYTRQASDWANRLLAVAPDYYDAYVATGVSEYIVGSLPAPLRWILHLGGFKGDKKKGIQELTLTAEHGRFLAPFARIVLAIVYLREGDRAHTRDLLLGLRREFPSNPLFAREIARLDARQR